MFLGPIFSLETTTSARRARYFAIRAAYVGVLLFTLWVSYQGVAVGGQITIRQVAALSSAFFSSYSIVQMLMVVGLAPALLAGTIAQERERRTIEYLFATDLSNVEIILGKLTARLLLLAYLVLAGLPVLSLAMLLGGISPVLLWLVLLVTFSSMLAMGSLALAVSVLTAKARDAVTRTYVLLIPALLLPPILPLTGLLGRLPSWAFACIQPINELLIMANPVYYLRVLNRTPINWADVWSNTWPLIACHFVLSLVCLLLALLGVRRVHLRAAGTPARSKWGRAVLRPAIGDHPLLWKESFADRPLPLGYKARAGLLSVALLAYLFVVWYVFQELASGRWNERDLQFSATMIGMLVSSASVLLLASRAAGCVACERERDTWTTLISTPVLGREIVVAKVLGNLFAARWLIVLLILLWGLPALFAPGFALAIPVLVMSFVLFSLYGTMLGTLYSLWCKNSLRAMGATMGTMLYVGGGYLFCCLPLTIGGGMGRGSEIIMAALIPFLMMFPGIYAVEGNLRGDEVIGVAYGLGMFGYFAITVLLSIVLLEGFDSLAGRTGFGAQRDSSMRRQS